MIPHLKSLEHRLSGSWFMGLLCAIMACEAQAATVSDYRPVFQECHRPDGTARLAIRRMEIDGKGMLLTVDPATLATSLEREQDWYCADTDDQAEKDTRLVRAVRKSCEPHNAALQSAAIVNGGLVHGGDASAAGSFVTGDLCPSRRPLDRDFIEKLEAAQPAPPIALSISGEWLTRHGADFQWLRDGERSGAWKITWVDHSYHHQYVPGRAPAENFLLMPGVDMQAEILETERLLIANGETPSVFFRFPGLVSNAALMRVTAGDHLIVLGTDAWLAKTPRARPGAIILVHLNGNEPAGLQIFANLLGNGKIPLPFRPIADAP
jgi:hypothetical protein